MDLDPSMIFYSLGLKRVCLRGDLLGAFFVEKRFTVTSFELVGTAGAGSICFGWVAKDPLVADDSTDGSGGTGSGNITSIGLFSSSPGGVGTS